MTDIRNYICGVFRYAVTVLLVCWLIWPSARAQGTECDNGYTVTLTVTSELPYSKVPMDPMIDFDMLIKQAGLKGVLNPNSIEVINIKTGDVVPHVSLWDSKPTGLRF